MPRIISEKEISKRRLKGELKGLKPVKKPKPKKDPLAELLSHVKQIVASSENVMEANNKLTALMMTRLSDMQPVKAPAPPGAWEFSIQRDSEGFIKKVHAKRKP